MQQKHVAQERHTDKLDFGKLTYFEAPVYDADQVTGDVKPPL